MKNRLLSIILCFLLLVPAVLTSCNNSDYIVFDLSDEENATVIPSVSEESPETEDGDGSDVFTPSLTRFMSDDNYYDVQNFYVFNKSQEETGNGESEYVPVVGFSFIDLAEREYTKKVNEPYVFLDEFKIDGYKADELNIDACLKQLSSPSFAGVIKTAPTDDDLAVYGLAHEADTRGDRLPEYVIAFNNDITDNNGIYVETVRQRIYFSKLTENNTRYAFTEIYKVKSDGSVGAMLYNLDMIVEVNSESLDFFEWDRYDWITPYLFNYNIAFCEEITLTSPTYSAKFTLDNSLSDCTEKIHSTYIKVYATDSESNEKTPFSYIDVVDKSGNTWTITSTDVLCFSPIGNELTITTAYYDHNFIGNEVCGFDGYISCADGSKVYVTVDEVTVVTADNNTVTYLRYELPLFRRYYMSLLYSTFYDSCELSDSEKAVVTMDENLILTMNITYTDGKTDVYKFYELTSSTSYVTVNGNGLFCILNSRVDKMISDAQKFFANEIIEAK